MNGRRLSKARHSYFLDLGVCLIVLAHVRSEMSCIEAILVFATCSSTSANRAEDWGRESRPVRAGTGKTGSHENVHACMLTLLKYSLEKLESCIGKVDWTLILAFRQHSVGLPSHRSSSNKRCSSKPGRDRPTWDRKTKDQNCKSDFTAS